MIVLGPLIIDLVSRLVDKSLVHADTAEPKTRYRLLEVVRQYAEARLTDAAELAVCRRRHLEWYAAAAAAHDPDRGAAVVGEPSAWFDVEHDNLRAASATALATDPTPALELAAASWRFWVNRGLIAEGARWLTLALDASEERSALRARALAAMAVMHIRQAKATELTAIGEEIVDLLNEHGEPRERAHGYHQRALLTFMAGDWRLAQAQSDEALRVAAVSGGDCFGATFRRRAGARSWRGGHGPHAVRCRAASAAARARRRGAVLRCRSAGLGRG